ncbi:MAG: preprotein translocase subunit SecY [bacterium]
MLRSFQDIFKIPELKRRLLFTLAIIIAYRIGASIPTPGVNAQALMNFFANQKGTLFGFLDMFSGGALGRFSVFALGIMPYINASIIMSLLQTVLPYLERLSKEGEVGRKKITQYTRYGTVFLALIQSMGLIFLVKGLEAEQGIKVVLNPGLSFQLMTMLTLTTGTIVIMWLGEQITEFGVGNGISIIIFSGIVVRLPAVIGQTAQLFKTGDISLFKILFLMALVVGIVALVVFVEQGQRRVPVQYAKRIVGRRMYGGQSTYLPLRVDQSGVIAVIFAVSLMMFPRTVANFLPKGSFLQAIVNWMQPGTPLYTILYGGLIVFFCYFYTAVTFNPNDLAENMKKFGGFVPGIRPGAPTADYIDKILTRITLVGALFIVCIAIIPDFIFGGLGLGFWGNIFSGTAILIVVGVALDTMGQIESHLLMRHYDGFMGKGKLKGRYFNIK